MIPIYTIFVNIRSDWMRCSCHAGCVCVVKNKMVIVSRAIILTHNIDVMVPVAFIT